MRACLLRPQPSPPPPWRSTHGLSLQEETERSFVNSLKEVARLAPPPLPSLLPPLNRECQYTEAGDRSPFGGSLNPP